MSNTLNGQVALITGAGRGIGRAIAFKLARDGAKLVLNDIDKEPLQETMQALKNEGHSVVGLCHNINDGDFAERFIELAISTYKDIHIIVNNAGYTWDAVIHKMTDEQWHKVIDVHLTAPFKILRAAYPHIKHAVANEKESNQKVTRKVINVSSIAGLFGNAGQVNYAAAKAGIIGMTQSLAKEWGRLNTTVNCVAFSAIGTRLVADVADEEYMLVDGKKIKIGINSDIYAAMKQSIPLGYIGEPEDAAGAVYMFAIPEANYISGQTLMCSGGMTGF